MVGDVEIRVMYIRPVARGRALFGSLVPYGRVWTPSADSAMRISFSKDVQLGGQPLEAGSYSVWAIPDSTQWTLTFPVVDGRKATMQVQWGTIAVSVGIETP